MKTAPWARLKIPIMLRIKAKPRARRIKTADRINMLVTV
jgi:hypothetical protein